MKLLENNSLKSDILCPARLTSKLVTKTLNDLNFIRYLEKTNQEGFDEDSYWHWYQNNWCCIWDSEKEADISYWENNTDILVKRLEEDLIEEQTYDLKVNNRSINKFKDKLIIIDKFLKLYKVKILYNVKKLCKVNKRLNLIIRKIFKLKKENFFKHYDIFIELDHLFNRKVSFCLYYIINSKLINAFELNKTDNSSLTFLKTTHYLDKLRDLDLDNNFELWRERKINKMGGLCQIVL